MNASENTPLIRQVSSLLNTVLNLEKSRTFEVRGQRVYPSEVHLLLLLAERPQANATELAGSLGLTKGAISQTLTRLEKKGLVLKTRDTARKNALNVEFTKLGVEITEYFQEKTTIMQKRVEEYCDTLAEDDREVIERFLEHLNETLIKMGNGE